VHLVGIISGPKKKKRKSGENLVREKFSNFKEKTNVLNGGRKVRATNPKVRRRESLDTTRKPRSSICRRVMSLGTQESENWMKRENQMTRTLPRGI